jgi:hypothetical protein
MKTLKWMILLLSLYGSAKSQQMYFHLSDGGVHAYPIGDIISMQFNSSNVILIMSNEATITYELSALNYYRYFPESVTLIADNEHPKLMLYPNPVETNLKLNYFFPKEGKGIKMQIVDRKGTIILEKQLDASEKTIDVDVHNLTSGHYYCIIGSGELLLSKAFIKQ